MPFSAILFEKRWPITFSGFRFLPCHYIVMENERKVTVEAFLDRGSIQEPCVVTCRYRTVEGTAKEHSDFVPAEGVLTFEPFDTK